MKIQILNEHNRGKGLKKKKKVQWRKRERNENMHERSNIIH